MKIKFVFSTFMILTAFAMRSQDTTDVRPITLPAWMVKEMSLDLNDRQYLRSILAPHNTFSRYFLQKKSLRGATFAFN